MVRTVLDIIQVGELQPLDTRVFGIPLEVVYESIWTWTEGDLGEQSGVVCTCVSTWAWCMVK